MVHFHHTSSRMRVQAKTWNVASLGQFQGRCVVEDGHDGLIAITASIVFVLIVGNNGLQCHSQLRQVDFHDDNVAIRVAFNAMVEKDTVSGSEFGVARNSICLIRSSLGANTDNVVVQIEDGASRG